LATSHTRQFSRSFTRVGLNILGASIGFTAQAAPATPVDAAIHQSSASNVTSVNAPDRENLVVRAKRENQMEVTQSGDLGVLGHMSGLDAPFNVRSYTSSIMLNQQAQTLGEVLENDPSVRMTLGYGNFSQMFIIRGLAVAGDDVGIDGLYGIAPRQLLLPQLYEQVQVLNGTNAFVNGAAPGGTSIGGSVNLKLKQAGKDPITRLTGNYGSRGQGGGALDVSRRFGRNDQFGFRLNAAGMGGNDAIEGESRRAVAIGGAFDWHDVSNHTRLITDIAYQNQGVYHGRPGVLLSSTLTSVPRPPSASANYGLPWTYTNLNYLFGLMRLEHDFTPHLMGYASFGGQSGWEKGDYAQPTVTDVRTGAATYGGMYVPAVTTNESLQAGFRGKFDTGPLRHEVNLGGSSVWTNMATAYSMALTKGDTNLYGPYGNQAHLPYTFSGGNVDNPQLNNATRLWSLFFSDTVKAFHDRVALTAGFRYQNIRQISYNYGASPADRYAQGAFTPVVGLTVHPTRHTAIYFNRSEGLSPGPTAGGNVVNLGEIFPPYRTVQYEVGAKYIQRNFAASLALFQMSIPSSYVEPLGDTGRSIYTVNGMQHNRGIELNINGTIVKGLRFNGGATVLDATQVRTANGAQNGLKSLGVPGYMISGNIEYDVPKLKGLTLVARVEQTGHQWANADNTQRVPAWTRADLAARYVFLAGKKPLTLRFGVDNIANNSYWTSAYGGYLYQGLPRVYKFSFTTDL